MRAAVSKRNPGRAAPRLCLAASGGGHLRQLLDLESVWGKRPHLIVTEDSALGRSLAEKHRVAFVAHYALGQARLGHPLRMLVGAARNLAQSARIVLSERPGIVLTTGAGAVFFTVLFARMLGARVVHIESFARFDRPSAFGRIAARFAHARIVQAAPLLDAWPDAKLFDPLRVLDEAPPTKQALTFATVGATLPFPRLFEAVRAGRAAGALPGKLIVQVGEGAPTAGFDDDVECVETIAFARVQTILRDAELVIAHGGTGSLVTALRAGCRVVAIPRRFGLGEHYDDHQEEITSVFARRGLIEVARDAQDLSAAVTRSRARQPVIATTDHSALAAHLETLVAGWTR